jgi:UDP-N-acetylglucosamine 3-dehydrogenase
MTNLRVALVGLGVMGKNHARILSNLEGVDFCGTHDVTPSVTSRYHQFSDLQDLIESKPDYCVIASPTSSHESVASKLIENQIAILIEKPIALNTASAQRIINLARKHKVKGAVGHIERYNPAIQEAKQKISSGALGKIYQINTIRQGPRPDRIRDVGVIKDLATHDIDIIKFVLGTNYKEIFAKNIVTAGAKHEGIFLSMGELDSGALFSHIVNWENPFKERKVSILGENGTFVIDLLSATLSFHEHGTLRNVYREIAHYSGSLNGQITQSSIEKYEPLHREHEEFRNYILNQPHEIITLEDAANTLSIAELMNANAV